MPSAISLDHVSALDTYIDTSTLVKRYLPEPGSQELEARLLAEQPRLLASEFVKIEMLSALRRRERQGLVDRAFCNAAHALFLGDLLQRAVETVRLDSARVEQAARLLGALGSPLATLDALHLATALDQRVGMFYTHDAQLSRAAREVGLSVWPEF